MKIEKLGDRNVSETGPRNGRLRTVPVIGGLLLLIIVPLVHIALFSHFWEKYSWRVDRNRCSCSCWDTVFKGSYESGVAGYKHVYFNATSNTLKIWISTVIFMISSYEAVKYLIRLALLRKLRFSMFLLFASVYYSHYYSWWGYFNYWNDEFYSQWNHQLFFTITEVLSTVVVVHLCDKEKEVTPRNVLFICSIAIAHISISGVDQFIENVILGEGRLHQVLRDLFLMLPDLLHVFVPLLELHKVAVRKRTSVQNLISSREFLAAVSTVIFLFGVSRLL